MALLRDTVEVAVAPGQAYAAWLDFEQLPRCVEGIDEIRRLAPTRLYWRVRLAGAVLEWESEIVTQVPAQAIAWRSVRGLDNSGRVDFIRLAERRTRVALELRYSANPLLEVLAHAVGANSRQLRTGLLNFKRHVEAAPPG